MNDSFKAMTDKQLSYIKKLECTFGSVDSALLKTITERRDKISTRLASKVINHLVSFNEFMLQAMRHRGISNQDVFAVERYDDDEKNIIKVILSL